MDEHVRVGPEARATKCFDIGMIYLGRNHLLRNRVQHLVPATRVKEDNHGSW
jgi:hypothetical protein